MPSHLIGFSCSTKALPLQKRGFLSSHYGTAGRCDGSVGVESDGIGQQRTAVAPTSERGGKPHPSGNPMGFRGSVQILPMFFPDLENRAARVEKWDGRSGRVRASIRVLPGKQVRVILVIKDGNEQITGDR